MPGIQDYINNRLPKHLTDPNSLWGRDPLGSLTNTSQYARKLRNQGRAGRDPKTAQWDWLYSGSKRPPGVFDGSARKGKQKNQLAEFHRWGYNPSPGTRFDPSMGTVGGTRQVVGTRPVSAEWWNDPALGGANAMSGGLDQYRFNAFKDLMKPQPLTVPAGAFTSRDEAKGGRGGKSTDDGDGFVRVGERGSRTITGDFGGGDIDLINDDDVIETGETSERPRYTINSKDRATGDQGFGAEMTPMAKAIQLAMEEAALGNFGQARALINNGIMGPAAMQKLLELVEDRENRVLMDLPGRVSDRLDTNKAMAADAKRTAVRGLEGNLSPLGVQRPGMAAMIASTSAVPVAMDESRRASSITENAKDFADSVFVGQGNRRSDLLKENIKSKVLGLQLMSSATGQGQGLIGERYWDTANPLDAQLDFQSGLMDKQAGINANAASQQQGYTRINMQYQGYLDRLLSTNQINQQTYARLWLEQQFKQYGLGEYNDPRDFWDRYAQYVGANADAISRFT